MYDGGTSTNRNNLLWYEIGRSSGHSDAENDSSRKVSGLISDISALQARIKEYEAYLPAVTQNRDDAHNCAWALHHQLEEAKQGIAVLLKASEKDWQFFKEQRANNRKAIESWEGLLADETRRHSQSNSFARAVIAAAWFLIRAAEAGNSNRQDYIELKTMYEHMTDLWCREKTDARDDPEFNRRAKALMESLSK